MSYNFGRDRTAELQGSDSQERVRNDSDEFGPPRQPLGQRYQRGQRDGNNPFDAYQQQQQQQPRSRYGGPDTSQQESYEMDTLPPANLDSTEGFLEEINRLRDAINGVDLNINKINELHESLLVNFDDSQWKSLSQRLDNLKMATRKQNMIIKSRLEDIKASNTRNAKGSSGKMRRSQTETIRKRFLEVIKRYQQVEANYEKRYRERIEDQIRIVKPEATQEDVDAIISSDHPTQIFAQSLMQASRMGQGRAVLTEVESRHDDIKKIEKTIIELHQLFIDMNTLLEQQGEMVDEVDQNVVETTANLDQGNQFIDKAIVLARSTRAKKWCCFFFVIALCVMIAILVWWFGFDHKGLNTGSGSGS